MIDIREIYKDVLKRKGQQASAFITENKNAKVQLNKILPIL